MDTYVVSARKYRPLTFDSVVGQPALTTTLRNAVRTGHLAHAYLFCGPRGVGKTTCARIFARTINCLNPTADGEACQECESCRAMREQRSLNIHELDAASNNSVDDIRQLVEQVRIPPQIGRYKVYIIDEVHMLSASAFNAFLKTLEEPPRHAIFILATTEKHKILPTILSRCQIYDFQRIGVEDTVAHLAYVAAKEGISAEPEALGVIALKADGGMRDALSIFDQVAAYSAGHITYQSTIENLNVLDYEYYFRLVDLLLAGDVTGTLLLLDDVLRHGFDAQQFVTGLSSHLRDLLVSRDAATLSLLEVGASIRDRYRDQATRCPLPFLYQGMRLSNDCDQAYRTSRNKRLLVELTLIRMAQLTGADGQASAAHAPSATQSGAQASQPALRPIQPQAGQGATATAARKATSATPSTSSFSATIPPATGSPQPSGKTYTNAQGSPAQRISAHQVAEPAPAGTARDIPATAGAGSTQVPASGASPTPSSAPQDTPARSAQGSGGKRTTAPKRSRSMGFSIKAALNAAAGPAHPSADSQGAPSVGPADSATPPTAAASPTPSTSPTGVGSPQAASSGTTASAPTAAPADRAVTVDDINQAWQEYAAALPREQTAMARRMQGMRVSLLDDGVTFEAVVDNDMAQRDFRAIVPAVEAFIRPRLGNRSLRMEVRVSTPDDTVRAYSRVERYQMMSEKNPALQELTAALGLELY